MYLIKAEFTGSIENPQPPIAITWDGRLLSVAESMALKDTGSASPRRRLFYLDLFLRRRSNPFLKEMRVKTAVRILLFLSLASALNAAAALNFKLPDSLGTFHTPQEWQHRAAVVLLFISVDCPLSNRYAPTINQLQKEYGPANVAFYAIQSDPDVTRAAARKHAADYGFQFPVLLDAGQALAGHYGVSVTPTAVVVSGKGDLLYRGRIDDRAVDFGQWRNFARKQDLREAIGNVVAGKPVEHPFPEAVGCFLPPKGTK
jgi:peroxiredoxin